MERSLPKIVKKVLESYDRVGGLNNTDGHNLPSKRQLHQICEQLLELLFPGFHDEKPIHRGELGDLTAERIDHLAAQLEDQITKSLRVPDPKCPKQRAQEILFRFLDQLPSIRELLRTDIEAAYEGDPAALSNEEILLSYPFIETISIQRLAHRLYKECVPLLPRMMTEWAHARTGIDIHPGAEIGPHFFIDHGTGVVIGETCRIGARVKLYHGVTLGARSFAKDAEGHLVKGGKRHPDVGDRVTIYPNSTILGGETVIGTGSTIGANVFLMHSVPPGSLVIYEEKQLRILDKSRREPAAGDSEWSI
ncbi:MAG: serine O-acetyltransferase EpsC [Terrimicrobiaceae bacterium]|nr:serine O-acetyltransferase EpsC [Terrimicrobiaceae bacterium]